MNAATKGTLQEEKPVIRFKIGMGIPSMITWSFDGKQVAIEGSWDNWRTRDFLQKSGKDFTINEGAPIRCFTITSLSLMDNGGTLRSYHMSVMSCGISFMFSIYRLSGLDFSCQTRSGPRVAAGARSVPTQSVVNKIALVGGYSKVGNYCIIFSYDWQLYKW